MRAGLRCEETVNSKLPVEPKAEGTRKTQQLWNWKGKRPAIRDHSVGSANRAHREESDVSGRED